MGFGHTHKLCQGIRLHDAVVVHDPEILIVPLKGSFQRKVEPPCPAQVGPSVVIGDHALVHKILHSLLRSIGTRVVDHEDITGSFAACQRFDALLQQVLAVVRNDQRCRLIHAEAPFVWQPVPGSFRQQ